MKKLTLLALAMVAMAAVTANADVITWDNDLADNNWFLGANWNPDVADIGSNFGHDGTLVAGDTPTAGSNVNINGSLTLNGGDVYFNGQWNAIGNGAAGVVDLNSGSLNVNAAHSTSAYWGYSIQVGSVGNPTLNQSGGTLNVSSSTAGQVMPLFVGRSNTGTYNLSGGVANISGNVELGPLSGGKGFMNVSGGVLNVGGRMDVGEDGSGTGVLTITGGTITTGDYLTSGDGGVGTIHIIGDAATITAGVNKPLGGGCFYINQKSKLKLTIDGGISVIDASQGYAGGYNVDPTLGSTLEVDFASAPSVGDVYNIIKYNWTNLDFTNHFDSLVDSPYGPDTVQLAIDYGSGTDDYISLSVVSIPEPATLALLSLGGLLLRRRRNA